jgi:hypothetical protein
MRVNIKDGWRPWQSARFAGSPLRLARKGARSTSPAFGEGGQAASSTSEAGGGGSMRSIETEGAAGAKRQRIGVTFALEALGADLGEAFDVVAHRDERSDAREECGGGKCAGWAVGRPVLIPEANLCDLAGSCADRCVEACLVVDDQRLDVETKSWIAFEQEEALRAEHLRRHQRNAVPGSADALLHRVSREECAQDDPEQLHDLQNTSGFSPADLRVFYPTKFVAWGLKSGAIFFRCPTDLRRLFDTKQVLGAHPSRRLLRNPSG